MKFYQLRAVAVSDDSRFLILGGWTRKEEKPGVKKYPFISFFFKKNGKFYTESGFCILQGMEGSITILEFMPKKQNGYIFFLAFDTKGNFTVHRTNGIQFDQVYYHEKYHTGNYILIFLGIVNCIDHDYNMRLISCGADKTIKSCYLYPS